MRHQKNIAIIGFGRFGQLLAEILRPAGNIFIVSRRKISSKGVRQIGLEGLAEMDWVIPAVPISALEATLREINPCLKPGSLVLDVSSVKVWPCRWLKKNIRKDVEIIGTHPMFGPDSAKNGLRGLQLVICPLRQSAKTLQSVKKTFSRMGLKIIETAPEEHDRQAARSLALVHFIGRGLAEIRIGRQPVSTLGFERLLKVNETVSNDTWQLFLDMHKYNPYAKKARLDFVKALDNINHKIKQEEKR